MTKLHNGIEYSGGETVWATGTSKVGVRKGIVIGFTKGGQFQVELQDEGSLTGKVIRTNWVSPR